MQDETAFWFARMRSDNVGRGDRARFMRWLNAAPENAADYSRCERLWDDLQGCAADDAILAMRQEALALAPERPRRDWRRFSAIAATLAILLIGGPLLLRDQLPSVPREATAVAHREDVRIYRTAIGQRSAFTLDDGSIVELNTDSLLQVDYAAGRRDVRLLRGEAHFDVAHDSSRPFVVEAAGQTVTALGTAFDVRVEAGEMRVTLIEGRVAVAPVRDGAVVARPAARLLRPGEQLIANADQGVEVRAANVERAVSWRTGRVIFDDEPLGDVIEEVNRYSERKVRLGGPELAAMRVSGVFRAGSVRSFVAALDAAFPISARDDGEEIVLAAE